MTRRKLLAAGGAMTAYAVAVACTPAATPAGTSAAPGSPGAASSPSAAGKKFGGTAIINQGQEPDTLLPFSGGTIYAGNILAATANGLMKLQIPEMNAVPDLAESYTVSADGRTYTFKMRKGIKWHDGQAFDINAIPFTFQVLASPDRSGPLSPILAVIAGTTEFKSKAAKDISGIKVTGDDTVQFTLTDVSPLFLVTAAASVILPPHILKDVPVADMPKHPFARKPIYTGPFMVQEWKQGEGVTLKAFNDHFAGRPQLDTIVSRGIPDAATALAELRAGGVHLHFVPADQFGEFERDTANFTTQRFPGTSAWYWQMDLQNPLFSDIRVRKAISHAVDRKSVVDALFRGAGEPSYSLVSPLATSIYEPNTARYEYDTEKAKGLLDEAGWKPGSDGIRVKDGKRLSFKIMASPRTSPWAQAFQPQLKAVGIEMQIEQLEFATILSKSKPGSYDMVFQGWGNFSVDPRNDVAANYVTPRATDYTGYNSQKINDLFNEAKKTADDAKQKSLYQEIQRIAEGDVVYIHLFRTQDLMVVRNAISIPKLKIANQLWRTTPEWQAR